PLRTLPAVQGTLAGVVSIGPDAAVRTGPDATVRTGVALAFGKSPNSERSDHRRSIVDADPHRFVPGLHL
ncbi:MAG: hypothetical protein D6772_03125, partial [Bacteroidetes bacterium]